MSEDFPTPDEIINASWKPKSEEAKPEKPKPRHVITDKERTAEQKKAISIILTHPTFVCIGATETGGDGCSATGSDFNIALNGPVDHLMGIKDHLSGVIDRAYKRKGLM